MIRTREYTFSKIAPEEQTLRVLRDTNFTFFRDPNKIGVFHSHSREYGYDLQSSFLTGYVLNVNEGGIVCRNLVRQEEYNARSESGKWLIEWSDFAHDALIGKYLSFEWSPVGPRINKEAITFKKDKYTDYVRNEVATIDDKKAVWMFTSPIPDIEYIEFKDPNLFFYLASRYYIREDDNSTILEKLADDILFTKDAFARTIPLFSFIAEHILVNRPNDFAGFVSELIDRIGGEEGFTMAYAIIDDLASISPKDPIYEWKQEQNDVLFTTWASLPENYALWRYKNRQAVIPSDVLERSVQTSSFWEELFLRMGIKGIMEEHFSSEELRPILETALRERKVIPGLILIFSHILGYDADEARYLAAVSLMGWGVIVSYDDIIDGHMMRKGVPTDLAASGLPAALDRIMLALASVLHKTLILDSDYVLIRKFITMLETSCRANARSRRISWDDDADWFIAEMENLISAFSWFPEFIGRQTNLEEAGIAYASFLSGVHTIGQMNNDIEDIEQDLWKHESGSDIGKRITLFWKTLVELPDEAVSPAEKQLVRSAWWRENPPDIDKILQIGLKHRADVIRRLYPHMKKIYDQAKVKLEEGFQKVLLMDATNTLYRGILLAGLLQEWRKFCKFGDIEDARPL